MQATVRIPLPISIPQAAYRRPSWLLSLAILLLCCTACASGRDDRQTLSISSQSGRSVKLQVEIADTPEKLERGLSGRDILAPDHGMLFVIEQRGLGFWMKDTSLPLSVAFISACGEIVALADMQPLSQELHNTLQPYRFGLEVNQGWFQRRGVGVGNRLTLPSGLKQPGC